MGLATKKCSRRICGRVRYGFSPQEIRAIGPSRKLEKIWRYVPMRRNIFFALAVVSCVLLGSCSGSMNQQRMTGNGVPMSLTIGDTPPNGVGVLFFEAMITGVSLQPSDAGKPAVSAVTGPVEGEL